MRSTHYPHSCSGEPDESVLYVVYANWERQGEWAGGDILETAECYLSDLSAL